MTTLFFLDFGIETFRNGYVGLGICLLTIFLGAFLNLVAVLGNNWQMPVLLKHAKEKEWLEHDLKHTVLNKKTRFKCLCDLNRQGIKDGRGISSIGDWLVKIGRNLAILTLLGHLIFEAIK